MQKAPRRVLLLQRSGAHSVAIACSAQGVPSSWFVSAFGRPAVGGVVVSAVASGLGFGGLASTHVALLFYLGGSAMGAQLVDSARGASSGVSAHLNLEEFSGKGCIAA